MSVFVFDGDDTLWDVEWLYSQSYADYFAYLYTILRSRTPGIHSLYDTFFRNEKEDVKTWGVKRGRTAHTMVTTYHQICQWVQEYYGENVYSDEHVRAIKQIGDQPFDITKHRWIPGAEETLVELISRGHTLCLLTKYDRELWPEKAAVLRTNRFFRDENILTIHGAKTAQDFEKVALAAERSGSVFYTVGNGKGDMVAVEAGDHWHGFYIPRSSTTPTEKDARPDHEGFHFPPCNLPRVTQLKDIREILEHV